MSSKELLDFANEMNKIYGEGAVMSMEGTSFDISVIPTGCISIDDASGIGGLPRGRIVEIYGPESSGKTTLALHGVLEAQNLGLDVLYIDAEHALDRTYMSGIGIDVSKVMISQPNSGQEALNILETALRRDIFGLIVIDSVAALVPQEELEGRMEDNSIGLQARLMSKALRKITGVVAKTNTSVIFINQTREKIGVMFGNPTTTTGGNALKFYASMRIEVWRSGSPIKDSGGDAMSSNTKAKFVKNKLAPPFRTAEFKIKYGVGIDKINDLLQYAVEYGIIERGGSWYKWEGESVAQGESKMIQFMEDNPEFLEEVKELVYDRI